MGDGGLRIYLRHDNLRPAFHIMRDCHPRGVLHGPDRPCLDPFQASPALLRHWGLQHRLGQLEVCHADFASMRLPCDMTVILHSSMPLQPPAKYGGILSDQQTAPGSVRLRHRVSILRKEVLFLGLAVHIGHLGWSRDCDCL